MSWAGVPLTGGGGPRPLGHPTGSDRKQSCEQHHPSQSNLHSESPFHGSPSTTRENQLLLTVQRVIHHSQSAGEDGEAGVRRREIHANGTGSIRSDSLSAARLGTFAERH